ncbi:DinB family protein [Mongoliitalea daihaiensis]|uniref:DinB family protein n=1 Tax=Mongoliitalea daihaiensis TaxID=2782006 RepID=UPI001F2BC2D1|nr:DinB family protein [Mongoliitalea daihaiensis]UJP64325.1 DinB family protein [Mongoliitalea daihaiensis]
MKQWIQEINGISSEVERLFGKLSQEDLHKKPNPSTWSIAENLQHLITLNSSYFPIFRQLKDGTIRRPFVGKFEFFTKLFGNMIYQSVSDGGKKKIKTFPRWEPKIFDPQAPIVVDFLKHQKELNDQIKSLQLFIEKEAVIYSPANKLIVYTLPKALDIIVAHEHRHLDQAKKLLNP